MYTENVCLVFIHLSIGSVCQPVKQLSMSFNENYIDYDAPITNRNRIEAYALTILLIFIIGSPVFREHHFFLLIAFFVAFTMFFYRRLIIDKELLVVVFVLILMTIVQTLNFAFFSFWTTVSMFTRFLFSYFAIRVIGHYFPVFYVRVLYILSIISLAFYMPSLLIPGFLDYLLQIPGYIGTADYARGTHLIIYTISTDLREGFLRNAGPFLEPGMFSVYLIIALLFNIAITKILINKVNIVFIIAIITTISTAGYLALIIVLIAYLLVVGDIKRSLSILILPFLIYGAWNVYHNFVFIGDKIELQYRLYQRGAVYAGRIGSTLVDLEDVTEYPLFGRGRHTETRFDDREYVRGIFHRTNGVTHFMVQFGLVFFSLYFYYIFKSLSLTCEYYKHNRWFAIFFFLAILIVGSSQHVFAHTLLISLSYLHANYKHINMVISDTG